MLKQSVTSLFSSSTLWAKQQSDVGRYSESMRLWVSLFWCESGPWWCGSGPCNVGQFLVMWVRPVWCGSVPLQCGSVPCNVGQSLVMWVRPLWYGSVPCDVDQTLVMWVRFLWYGSVPCDMGQTCVMWVSPLVNLTALCTDLLWLFAQHDGRSLWVCWGCCG